MNTEIWQALGTVLALLVIGGYNGYRSHKAERAAKVAAHTSARIEGKVGNGFPQDVMNRLDAIAVDARLARENYDRLKRMEGTLDEQRSLLSKHLEAHASHDLKES